MQANSIRYTNTYWALAEATVGPACPSSPGRVPLEVIRCAKGIHGTEGSTMGDLQAAINGLLLDNPQYVEKVVLDENFGHVKVSIVNGAIVEVNEDEE